MKKIILILLMVFVPLNVHAANYEITTPGNNVGIGSTALGTALDVNGTGRFSGTVQANQIIGIGSGNNTFTGNVGIGTVAQNQLDIFSASGGSGLRIDNSASYGYGPTLTGYDINDSQSRIYFTGSLIADNSQSIYFGSSSNFGLNYQTTFDQIDLRNNSGYYPFILKGSTSSVITDYFAPTTSSAYSDHVISSPLTVQSGGNVGIGSLTPGQTLDVQGTIRAISGGTCTTLYRCTGGVDAGVIQTSACSLCAASTCGAMNGCF